MWQLKLYVLIIQTLFFKPLWLSRSSISPTTSVSQLVTLTTATITKWRRTLTTRKDSAGSLTTQVRLLHNHLFYNNVLQSAFFENYVSFFQILISIKEMIKYKMLQTE